ncbi:MAG: beta-lactamase family protein [Rhodospirillales bacterium]|nr:beta-lactamase family protein [Rhodospirillales bacterium]MDE2574783.1 beta-lactamase family protein [Rhodospirillales bacterium]
MIAAIDRVLEQACARIPGVVAAATTETETLYEGAFGRRDLTADAPMTMDTVFWLASMTKALVSAGAMQHVEAGRLALDAPIGDTLPALAGAQLLDGFSESGAPVLRAPSRPVTLRHLLSHSAGYGYDTWNEEIARYMKATGLPRAPNDWAQAARMPLLFEPGTRWNYGINTDFVGKAVEAASGKRLDEALAEQLFAPLGMTDTTVSLTAAQRARMARVHGRAADGSLAPIEWPVGNGPGFCMGGGSFCGTASDYLRFLRMLLNQGTHEGQRLLWPRTVAEMGRNQIGAAHVVPMRSSQPARSTNFEAFPGMAKKWGLGFLLTTEDVPGGRRAGSMAWAGLGNTYFWVDPTRRVAGVVMMQVLPFGDAACLDTLAEFERAVYAAIG